MKKRKGVQVTSLNPLCFKIRAAFLADGDPHVAVGPAALVAGAAVRDAPVVDLRIDHVLAGSRECREHANSPLARRHHDLVGACLSTAPTSSASATATAATRCGGLGNGRRGMASELDVPLYRSLVLGEDDSQSDRVAEARVGPITYG